MQYLAYDDCQCNQMLRSLVYMPLMVDTLIRKFWQTTGNYQDTPVYLRIYTNISVFITGIFDAKCTISIQCLFGSCQGVHQLLFRSDQGHFIILQWQKIIIPSFLPHYPYTSSPIINITPANLFFLSPQPTRPRCSLVKNGFIL